MTTASPFHLLVIDDDNLIHESLKLLLPSNWKMTSMKVPKFVDTRMMVHAVFVDMHLDVNSHVAHGPEIILQVNKHNPQTPIVAMSGDLSMELMEQCLKNGAEKYLAKPLRPEEVLSTLEKIEALWMIKKPLNRNQVIWQGDGPSAQKIKQQVASMRGEGGPILIEGETGTGKEVAYRMLNQQEKNRASVTVNIASIPENLFESEMFGHMKGAFTGADSNKIGLIEAAHGGDLFLDEIEALPLSQQVKLLRFLENGEVRRVGSTESTFVNVRVICASNQNLKTLVSEGKFREDLLFRLSGKKMRLPPLRERAEDVPLLADYFLKRDKPNTSKQFSKEALELLQKYSWPGNVRELKRICEQLHIVSPLPIIRPADVSRLMDAEATQVLADLDYTVGLSALVEKFEAEVIRKVLQKDSDVDNAAQLLKVSRSNLYKKIKDYGIES